MTNAMDSQRLLRLVERVALLAHPAVEISATEIRRRVRDGLPIRYWVPDPVAGYISRHRLYLDPA